MLAHAPSPVVERTSATAGIVAHHAAQVVSSRWFPGLDSGCGSLELSSLRARLTLPAGVSFARGSVASVDVPVRLGMRTARWHVHAVRPGVRAGRVVWTGLGTDGVSCRTVIKLRLVVAAASPRVMVAGAARYHGGVAVVVRGVLPGVNVRSVRFADYPGAFGAFFLDHPERVAIAVSPGRGLGDLFFAQGRGQLTGRAEDFGSRGVGCVSVADPHKLPTVPYRIAFTWNHELGVSSFRSRGAVSVSPAPVTDEERSCVAFFTRVVLGGPGDGG
jgi:hypothetical protein